MMVEVVNMRTCNPPFGQPGDVRIDRASKYGNPFIIGEGYTRDSACDAYEAWFMQQNFDMTELLHAKRLVCHCKPRRCHGDFIKKQIEAYSNGMQKTLLDGDGA
jgi:hypothetical protein